MVKNLSFPFTGKMFISLTDSKPSNSRTKGHILLLMSSVQSPQFIARYEWRMVDSGIRQRMSIQYWAYGAKERCRHRSQQAIYNCKMYRVSSETESQFLMRYDR